MDDIPQTLRTLYQAFNAREVDAVLVALHPDVEWPNGWEGGYLSGQAEVRDYWLRQWAEIDPTVTPQSIVVRSDGRFDVEVHQVVRTKTGETISDSTVHHVYRLRDELFDRMDIEPAT